MKKSSGWFKWSHDSDKKLRISVEKSDGYSQVIFNFGWKSNGGSYARVKKRIVELGLDTSHFMGSGHGRAHKKRSSKNIKNIFKNTLRIYIDGEKIPKTSHTRLKIIKYGMKKPICEKCNLGEWMGAPIPLELDHIDGNKLDNRLKNLRLLCPNCHAQTETHGSKNRETMRKFRASGIDLSELSTKKEDCIEIAEQMGWTISNLQTKILRARRAKKLAAQSAQSPG